MAPNRATHHICRIFSQTCISDHSWGKFTSLWCSDLEMRLRDTKVNLDNFTQGGGKLLILPQTKFLRKFIPSQQKGERKLCNNNPKMGY